MKGAPRSTKSTPVEKRVTTRERVDLTGSGWRTTARAEPSPSRAKMAKIASSITATP
jgi:hypothetical protein